MLCLAEFKAQDKSFGGMYFNEAAFRSDVANAPWVSIYACTDVDTAAELFTTSLTNIADTHAPIKRIKCKTSQPKWVTSDFLSCIDEKQHWTNINRRRPSPYNAERKRLQDRLAQWIADTGDTFALPDV